MTTGPGKRLRWKREGEAGPSRSRCASWLWEKVDEDEDHRLMSSSMQGLLVVVQVAAGPARAQLNAVYWVEVTMQWCWCWWCWLWCH